MAPQWQGQEHRSLFIHPAFFLSHETTFSLSSGSSSFVILLWGYLLICRYILTPLWWFYSYFKKVNCPEFTYKHNVEPQIKVITYDLIEVCGDVFTYTDSALRLCLLIILLCFGYFWASNFGQNVCVCVCVCPPATSGAQGVRPRLVA